MFKVRIESLSFTVSLTDDFSGSRENECQDSPCKAKSGQNRPALVMWGLASKGLTSTFPLIAF